MTMKITTVPAPTTSPGKVDILILGAGWTSTFLIPLLQESHIIYAATSTTGRPGTIPFVFSPSSSSLTPYHTLPTATTILITFPLTGTGASAHLLSLYTQTHPLPDGQKEYQWIQLGSTGIWSSPSSQTQIQSQSTAPQNPEESKKPEDIWVTRHSPYDQSNSRAQAEDQLLFLGGCVLNLSGLWGGERQPSKWLDRVATSKEAVAGRGSLHLVHGMDVARSIVAVHENWEKAGGERWMLTDMKVYDWWSLIMFLASEASSSNSTDAPKHPHQQAVQWVASLMTESHPETRALPRSMTQLGRCYDTREFWKVFGIVPLNYLN